MGEIIVRSDAHRPGINLTEDIQNFLTDGPHWRFIARPYIWRPPTDVYETEEAIIVRVEIAGMHAEDFSISLIERSLVIRGIRRDLTERRAYHQMEIPFGEFITEVELTYPIVIRETEATYQDGFLRIVLPKVHPQHIKVEG